MQVNSGSLITEAYRAQQQHLHETTTYGTAAGHYGGLVSSIIEKLEITHLLDYGCGKRMSLLKALQGKIKGQLKYQGYDPGAGLEELASLPIPAQMVCCIDVLEHIEPDLLDNVLDHLCAMTEVVAFLTIHTGPANKVLPDGRNAHINQQPMSYWLPKVWQRWDIQTVQKTHEHSFYCIAYQRPRLEGADGKKIV